MSIRKLLTYYKNEELNSEELFICGDFVLKIVKLHLDKGIYYTNTGIKAHTVPLMPLRKLDGVEVSIGDNIAVLKNRGAPKAGIEHDTYIGCYWKKGFGYSWLKLNLINL